MLRSLFETTMLLMEVPATKSFRYLTVSDRVCLYRHPQLSTFPVFSVLMVLYVVLPHSHESSHTTLPLLSRSSVGLMAVSLPNTCPVISPLRRLVICSFAKHPQLRVRLCFTWVAGISFSVPQSQRNSHTARRFPVPSMSSYRTSLTAVRRPQR